MSDFLVLRQREKLERLFHGNNPPTNTAVHEAGHTLATWFCTDVVCIDRVTINGMRDGSANYAGRTEYSLVDRSENTWSHAVIKLAGMAAEVKVFGRTHSYGCSGDLQGVLQTLRRVAKPPVWPPPTSTVALAFDRMFVQPLPKHEVEMLNLCLRYATDLLNAHESKFEKIIQLLRSRRSVRETDLARVLGSRKATEKHRRSRKPPTFLVPVEKTLPKISLWQRLRRWLRL